MLEALTIVVPCRDEEATVGAALDDALAWGARAARALEVVVCDDGSRDASAAILDDLARREPRVRVLRRARSAGIEASIRALYAAARHPWVFVNSADLQWPMRVLAPMARAAEEGADLVLGVRRDKRAAYTHYRRALSAAYAGAVRAFGARAADPGSIKLGRRELLHRPLVARGVFAEGERIVRACWDGARVAEIEVEFHPRRAGRARGARPRIVLAAALDVARLASSRAAGWPAPSFTRDDDPWVQGP